MFHDRKSSVAKDLGNLISTSWLCHISCISILKASGDSAYESKQVNSGESQVSCRARSRGCSENGLRIKEILLMVDYEFQRSWRKSSGKGGKRPQNRGKTGPHGIRDLEMRWPGSQGDFRTDINRDKDTMRLVPLDAKQMMVARWSVGFQEGFQELLMMGKVRGGSLSRVCPWSSLATPTGISPPHLLLLFHIFKTSGCG